MKLQGKVALVTGGATGIGRESVLALAREGAAVAVNYSRSQADAQQTARDARQSGAPAAISVQTDVSDDAQVRRMVHQVAAELGRLDILVNNAGHTHFVEQADLEGLTEEMWDRILAVNLKGAFFCSRAVAPVMRQQGEGCIINVASIAGLTGGGSCIAYAASKAAVICLTKSLATAWSSRGINVNCIAPGYFETDLTDGLRNHPVLGPEISSRIPCGRWGRPDEVAGIAVFLASDASNYMHGSIVPIDGGWLAR